MTVQHLVVGRPGTVPTDRIEVELIDFGGIGTEVDLVDAKTGQPARFHRISATKIASAAPDNPLRLVARLPDTSPFPDSAEVQVVVRVGHDPELTEFVSPRHDVGALRQAALVEIHPMGDLLRLDALKVDDAAELGQEDQPLEGLARAAMYAARTVRQGQGDDGHRGVVLCVDTSASMRLHLRSGLTQALVEIALGIDRGMGDGADMPVFGVATGVTALPAINHTNIAGYAERVLAAQPPASGCRPTLLADHLGEDRRDRTVLVLTDQLPGDLAECGRQWSGDVAEWHLVVIGGTPRIPPAGFGACAVPAELTMPDLTDEIAGRAVLRRVIADMTEPSPRTGARA